MPNRGTRREVVGFYPNADQHNGVNLDRIWLEPCKHVLLVPSGANGLNVVGSEKVWIMCPLCPNQKEPG